MQEADAPVQQQGQAELGQGEGSHSPGAGAERPDQGQAGEQGERDQELRAGGEQADPDAGGMAEGEERKEEQRPPRLEASGSVPRRGRAAQGAPTSRRRGSIPSLRSMRSAASSRSGSSKGAGLKSLAR